MQDSVAFFRIESMISILVLKVSRFLKFYTRICTFEYFTKYQSTKGRESLHLQNFIFALLGVSKNLFLRNSAEKVYVNFRVRKTAIFNSVTVENH